MSLRSDLRVLYRMAFPSSRKGNTHAERLDGFYGEQAEDYDAFRERLLHGRQELFEALPAPEGGVWVDLGGGTGANIERLGDRLQRLRKVYVVDLASSLLKVADRRIADRGWTNVETVLTDATTFLPPEGPADVVTFSYSLTMIPDWFAAVDQAWEMLGEGGTLGVVDFYVSRKHPAEGSPKHSAGARAFWPAWFSHDNVFPSPDHLPYLRRKFAAAQVREGKGKIPYLPLARTPYYWFVGRKSAESASPA